MRFFIAKSFLRRQRGLFDRVAELEKTQYYSKSELACYQEEKMRLLIKHAYETVPYYRELLSERKLKPDDIKCLDDLEKIPVTDKETLRGNFEKMQSRGLKEKIYIRKTGGSTAVPLNIAYNYNANIIERALYYRFLGWLGYKFGDRMLEFWGEHPFQSRLSRARTQLRRKIYNVDYFSTYNVDDRLFLKLVTQITKAPPVILRGYTSSIYYLAQHALHEGVRLNLNAVTTTAEKLFKYQRNTMEEAFGRNIFDQYGCGETNSIAFECEKHEGLHVAAEHTIMELVGDDGRKDSRGHVIITNLDDYAMPIIRYRNGDQARWASRDCACNRKLPLLEQIEGRVYDFIEGPGGRKVHAGVIDDIFLDMNLDRKYEIKEFRIVQDAIDRLRLEFVTEKDVLESDQVLIRQKINRYLGNVTTEITKVDSLPKTKMGKRLFVLSLNNKDHWQQ